MQTYEDQEGKLRSALNINQRKQSSLPRMDSAVLISRVEGNLEVLKRPNPDQQQQQQEQQGE